MPECLDCSGNNAYYNNEAFICPNCSQELSYFVSS